MTEILQLEFVRNALVAGVLISVICGVIGSLVVVNRIVFLAGGIAHASYGGIGLAFFLGIPYLPGTICFSIISALIMAKVTLRFKHRSDTIVGVIWAAGMAIGVIMLDLTPGYNVDLLSYLFGSILAVPKTELWSMFGLTLSILIFLIFFYSQILAVSYDDEFASVMGIKVDRLYYLMITTVSVAVVVIVRAVGLIMVLAMLTISPYIAEKLTKSLKSMMLLASILNAIFVALGLFLSYRYDLTTGASIIMVATVFFGITMLLPSIIPTCKNLKKMFLF